MSLNTFGNIFRITSFGESHGSAIGGVIDGMPSNIKIDIAKDIQPFVDKRRPGLSRFTTQRREPDIIEVISGIFNGKTTGQPIAFLIHNKDVRSKDYDNIKHIFRPGHADYVYNYKYKNVDYRGGGRSSARETVIRVAASGFARKILKNNTATKKSNIRAALIQLGDIEINRSKWQWSEIDKNPFFCPDKTAIPNFEKYIDKLRRDGDSCGAIIEVQVNNMPAGLGQPMYSKLSSELAAALMGINAVKGIEIGSGFKGASQKGSQNNDQMRINKNKVEFLSNNNGGIIGGISSGQDLILRIALKPTSSIRSEQQSIDANMKNTKLSIKGRHDPCVGIRAAPIIEAMIALVLADQLLLSKALMHN